MKRLWISMVLLCLVALPGLADGPETGIVQGRVTDAEGSELPGVLLTLTGDRGSKNVVTEADGSYRFALLVPGPYVVKAELEGFQGGESAINVSAGGKHSVDISLRLGTSEEITVTSEAPMVDKFNVTAGSTVSAEVGAQTAGTTRTYYGLINALPGVTADAQNDDIQQTRPSVNGTHFADNNVFIDGVDTTFAKFGGSRVYLPTTAITEVSMEAGGSSAEYGRTIGSSTNVIVKSGTNRWHADGLVQSQQVDWGGEYRDQPSLAQREVQPFPVDWFERTDAEKEGGSTGYELSVGGPIRTDRAWFFIGASDFDDSFQERLLGGDPYDVSLLNEAYIAKFNFQPATAHSISASYVNTPAFRNYFNEESFDYWTPTPHENDSELYTVNYNYSVSSKTFLETKIAFQETQENKFLACDSVIVQECLDLKQQDRGPEAGHSATDTSAPSDLPLRFPSDGSQGEFLPGNNYYVYTDDNFIGAWHNGWILSDGFGFNAFPREQANVGVTQFAGANHEIKIGIDYQTTKWEGENSRTGFLSGYNYDSLNPFGYSGAGSGFFEHDGTTPYGEDTCGLVRAITPTLWDTTGRGRICVWVDYNAQALQDIRGSGDAEMQDTALFVRDRFTVGDHWTFNLGVRAELQEGFNDIRRQVIDATYIDPRLSATYDVKGDGKLLFTANAGRYHAMLNQAWIAGGGGTAGGMHDGWNGYEGQEVYLFCDGLDASLGLCGGEVGYNFFFSDIIPGRMWDPIEAGIFDHNIDPYFKEEFIVGAEWQMARNWALDVKYIDWSIKDMMFSNTQIDHLGRNIFLTGNYENLPSIVRALADARVANGLERAISDETIDAFKQSHNSYKGLQIQVNRRMANNFAIYNNVSFAETDTTGAGDWWNNTNSTYGENLELLLDSNMLAQCDADQDNRTVPVDCTRLLSPFLGQSVSTINRRGPNHAYDREVIFNSFGFKNWFLGQNGSHSMTLGGHLTYQTGTPWHRTEGVETVNLDGSNAANAGVALHLTPDGANGQRTSDEYTLNLSGAYGFPIGGNRVRGELRVEVLNVTDQQKRRDWDGRGEIYPVRRYFQRPRQARASFKISF